MNITIEFYIFELVQVPNFTLQILNFWTKFAKRRYFRSKTEKVNITIEFCIFELDQLYNSTDNFLPLILVSDWSIFHDGNSILINKRNENEKKHKIFHKKHQNIPRKQTQIYSNILYCEPAPLTRDVTCSKLQKYGENIGEKKFSSGTHSRYQISAQTDNFNFGGKISPRMVFSVENQKCEHHS